MTTSDHRPTIEDAKAHIVASLEYGVSPLIGTAAPQVEDCAHCDGRGEVTAWRPSSPDGLMTCPECDGTGKAE